MEIDKKIESLRRLMKNNHIDAYIIPSSDPHQSEYTTPHFKAREWISGFTGSAGTVVVTEKKAVLFTDGRYFLQAEEELRDTEIELLRVGERGVPSLEKFVESELDSNSLVGFDGRLFSASETEKLRLFLTKKHIEVNSRLDLIDEIWTDRPPLPKGRVFIHDVKFSGYSVREKLRLIRDEMKESFADYYLLSCLDSISWTFNIRGEDIPFNPVVLSYALIGLDDARIFIDKDKLDSTLIDYFKTNDIEVCDYSDINNSLKSLENSKSIYVDVEKTSISCYEDIPIGVKKIRFKDIVENLKAVKNEVEIENFKNAQRRDGVAVVKFLHWLENALEREDVSELAAGEKLEEIRREGKHFVSLSFETIVGYKDHASIVHYCAKPESEYKLEKSGMLLIDSGAQYLDGTTDLTRTIVLGEITDEEKRDFTLVLKGHIALSQAKFLYGTVGTQLDILARLPLLEEGKDYKHGTGHGIGYFLSVHEGPHRISSAYNSVVLHSGMLVTNEPGFYKDNCYGIRTENILLVRDHMENEYGRFMKFETTTLCPIDLKGIDSDLLSVEEKIWLNSYHKRVYDELKDHLNEDERKWLKKMTIEI